ncbi:hypothetical protein BY996DRAFT_8559457 [Phakopsora pachyrhizi]|nr:hypothetical protein BY996DRAFT_8559457 [Phakopsora pachyrhizi]
MGSTLGMEKVFVIMFQVVVVLFGHAVLALRLTEDMREHLKQAPQIIMAKQRELENAVSSSDGSSSDTSLVSTTDSSNELDKETKSSSGNSSQISHRERRACSGRDRGGRHNHDSPLSSPHRKDDCHRDTSGRAPQKPLSPNCDSDLSPPSKYSNASPCGHLTSMHNRRQSPSTVPYDRKMPSLRRGQKLSPPTPRHRDLPPPACPEHVAAD